MSTPAATPITAAQGVPDPRGDLRWYDLRHLTWEGRGWPLGEMEHLGDRLPARAEVPEEVRKKSHYAAGLCVRFDSDTDRVFLRWRDREGHPPVNKPTHSLPDLYVRSDRDGPPRWRWAGLSSNLLEHDRAWVTDGFAAAPREYLLYLGYLDGLSSLELGLAPGASLAAPPPRRQRPLLFYGTSITCGQSVSRAGLTFPALVGRMLDRPVLNLGFPGNGRMEAPTVRLLAELDPAVFVVACLENMDAGLVTERAGPLVACLRAARPTTPILLVESLRYENAWLVQPRAERVATSNAALRAAYARCLAAGVRDLHYLACDELLGAEEECTVDGTHANDRGAFRLAAVFARTLPPLLA